MKNLVIKNWPILIVVVYLIASISLGVRNYTKSQKYRASYTTTTQYGFDIQTPEPIKEAVSTKAPVPKPRISKMTKFPHEYLPGFNISIPDTYQVEFKQFAEPAKKGFNSRYFPTCHENCMGVHIIKNGVGLELSFDIVLDDSGFGESNNAGFEIIGGGWARIQDRDGYSYVKGLRNVNGEIITTGRRSYVPIEEADDWSAEETETTIQRRGTGISFEKLPPLNEIYGNVPELDGGLLLERPRVIGNPSAEQLKEIDTMVLSIVGIRN